MSAFIADLNIHHLAQQAGLLWHHKGFEANLQAALAYARRRLGLADPESTQQNLKTMARCVELEAQVAAAERQAIEAAEVERRTREQRDAAIVEADLAKQELKKLRGAHGAAGPPADPKPAATNSYVTRSFSLEPGGGVVGVSNGAGQPEPRGGAKV